MLRRLVEVEGSCIAPCSTAPFVTTLPPSNVYGKERFEYGVRWRPEGYSLYVFFRQARESSALGIGRKRLGVVEHVRQLLFDYPEAPVSRGWVLVGSIEPHELDNACPDLSVMGYVTIELVREGCQSRSRCGRRRRHANTAETDAPPVREHTINSNVLLQFLFVLSVNNLLIDSQL